MNNRVKVDCAKWIEVSGVMCDKNMPIKIKYKIYKTIVMLAMTHMSECWAVEDKVTKTLHITEMRMLRWRHEDIYIEANIELITTFLRQKCDGMATC